VHVACAWAAKPKAKTSVRGIQAFIGNPLVIETNEGKRSQYDLTAKGSRPPARQLELVSA
jgi:hypothetical protein